MQQQQQEKEFVTKEPPVILEKILFAATLIYYLYMNTTLKAGITCLFFLMPQIVFKRRQVIPALIFGNHVCFLILCDLFKYTILILLRFI